MTKGVRYGMYKGKVVSKGDQKYLATTRHGGFALASDGSASSSIDALLASLCGCLAHYVGDYLRDQGASFSDYEISAEAELTQDRVRLAPIRVGIELRDSSLNESQENGLLQFVRQCQIHNTLSANGPIHISVSQRSSVAAGGAASGAD